MTPPGGRGARGDGVAALHSALVPVAARLLDDAQAAAHRIVEGAERDAMAELERRRAEAAAVLAEAQADGERVAQRAGGAELIEARLAARGTVLAARRRAYDGLRAAAVDALGARAATPGGAWIGRRVVQLVSARVGPGASVRRYGTGGLSTVAVTGTRRAALVPEDLVDEALASMADQVEGLWA